MSLALKPQTTIVALSSPSGGARHIVRLSGPRACEIAQTLIINQHSTVARVAHVTLSVDGIAFPATLYNFVAPKSYTGQDIVELHLPGSAILANMTVARLITAGAVQASPGEFTQRAFTSGRLSLAEAEGVAQTIAAESSSELAAARLLAGGTLSRALSPILESLTELLALVEVNIDFTEEGISAIPRDPLDTRLGVINTRIGDLLQSSARFRSGAHELVVVLVGKPNAGKSTLLNALARETRAVVSDIAGTTRDAIDIRLALPRGFAIVRDLAGIESSGGAIGEQMQAIARSQIETADLVVHLHASDDATPPLRIDAAHVLSVSSKSDLAGSLSSELSISAQTRNGLSEFTAELDNRLFASESHTTRIALAERHVHHITSAREAIASASGQGADELLAASLRETLSHLGSVLGEVTTDDLLGVVFSRFCIGK